MLRGQGPARRFSLSSRSSAGSVPSSRECGTTTTFAPMARASNASAIRFSATSSLNTQPSPSKDAGISPSSSTTRPTRLTNRKSAGSSGRFLSLPTRLLLLRGPRGNGGRVGLDRRPHELLERGLVDLLALVDVDRAPHIAIQAGIEQLLRIVERSSFRESELHHLLVGFSRADDAVMRPHGCSHPLPFFLDV